MDSLNKRIALTITLIFLMSLVTFSTPIITAQSVGSIIISADGSVTGTNNLEHLGASYALTANITGVIQVQKSDIIINGEGYSLNQGHIDLSNAWGTPTINNVTIKNLSIINGSIIAGGGGNNTFYNDYISNSLGLPSIQLWGSSFNNVSYCTLVSLNSSEGAIMITGGETRNIITQNNIIGGIYQSSILETVDRNYWSDYQTKYPNATEIDHSGIGNTPYVYYLHQNNETPPWQDNNPLLKPVAIPLMDSNPLSSPTPTPTVPEFAWLAILPLLVGLLSVAVTFKFRHRKNQANASSQGHVLS